MLLSTELLCMEKFFQIQSVFQPLTGTFGRLVVQRDGVASRKTLLSADFVAEKPEKTGRVLDVLGSHEFLLRPK